MKTGSVFLKVSNITRLFSKKCAANIRQHKSFEKKPFPIKKKVDKLLPPAPKKHRKPFAALKSRIWKKIHSIAPIYTAIICITYNIFSNTTTGHFSSIPLNSKRYCNMELFKKDSIWRLQYTCFFQSYSCCPSATLLSVPYQYWPAMDNNSCNVL